MEHNTGGRRGSGGFPPVCIRNRNSQIHQIITSSKIIMGVHPSKCHSLTVPGCPQEFSRNNVMRFGMRSIFLQVPTQNEDPFTVVCNGNFLCKVDIPCPNGFKVLKVPVPGENDVDFETVTDFDMALSSTRE